ncbi:MAG: dmsC [Neobacillus sp.]|nr:dmsC [Neobacillus sp.]
MEELPLIIFSICVQGAIGIMLFVALAQFINKEVVNKHAILTSAVLAIIGMIASLLHLGKPLRALYSLMNFGTSWLSREIWFTSVFAGITIIAAIFTLFKPTARKAIRTLVIAAVIVGLVDVAMIATAYSSTSVPAWNNNIAIYFEFYAAAISMGALSFFSLSMKEAANMKKTVGLTVAVAIVLQVTAMVLYYINLGALDSLAAQQSLNILASHGILMSIKWVSIILGAFLIFWPSENERNLLYSAYGATALIIIGQIGGRYLFYAMMVASQVGLH